MFMEQNAHALEQQAVADNFLSEPTTGRGEGKTDAQDAKLAQFKKQYLGSLPEENRQT